MENLIAVAIGCFAVGVVVGQAVVISTVNRAVYVVRHGKKRKHRRRNKAVVKTDRNTNVAV